MRDPKAAVPSLLALIIDKAVHAKPEEVAEDSLLTVAEHVSYATFAASAAEDVALSSGYVLLFNAIHNAKGD